MLLIWSFVDRVNQHLVNHNCLEYTTKKKQLFCNLVLSYGEEVGFSGWCLSMVANLLNYTTSICI